MKNAKNFLEWIFYIVIFVLIIILIISPVALFMNKTSPAAIPVIKIETDDLSGVVDAVVSEEKEQESILPELPAQYLIKDFEVIYQLPELPTGCEITAFTMALNYYGFNVSKEAMAMRFLPSKSPEFHRNKDGKLIGPDLNKYFIGNPASDSGYICGTTAVTAAAKRYFRSIKSESSVIDMTGAEPQELYRLVSEDTPVVVWVTIEMKDRPEPEGWYTEDGRYVDWSILDHGAVLIGYDEKTVTIADPLSGIITYKKEQFESVFRSRGNGCVVIVP